MQLELEEAKNKNIELLGQQKVGSKRSKRLIIVKISSISPFRYKPERIIN
jgi:hypothetical protein